MQKLKKLVRKPSKILAQVHNRISEMAGLNRRAEELKIELCGSGVPFPGCTSTKKEH